MSDTKKIVILGAGYAGVEAAKVLNKKFKKDNNVEITLINSNPYHT
ncbi:MAG: dehydrogenase, FAD-containing subunit, partial [Clostridia bacterium]|nr:dehydrogenase, FAD-containing subunit [Clostridia bacterium]